MKIISINMIQRVTHTADIILFWSVKVISLICFFLLFLLVSANVFIRINPVHALKVSLHSFDELREWFQIAMIFYGAAGIWILRDHFKLDMINVAIFNKNRVLQGIFDLFIEIASFAFIIIFIYASFYQVEHLFGFTNDLRIPEKFIFLTSGLIPGLVMGIYALRNIVLCIRRFYIKE